MVDLALVYVGGVLVLFFFWVYGIVAFVRDVKNKLVPAYRQYRRDEPDRGDDRRDGSAGRDVPADESRYPPGN